MCLYKQCPRETCYRHCFTILKSGRWASDRVTFFVTENTNTHTARFVKSNEEGAWLWLWTHFKRSFRQSRAATCHIKSWRLSRGTDCWPKSLEILLVLHLITSVTLQITHTQCNTRRCTHSKVWLTAQMKDTNARYYNLEMRHNKITYICGHIFIVLFAKHLFQITSLWLVNHCILLSTIFV